MAANQDFFVERRAAAEFKHGILKRYPAVFASKTGWRGRKVVFLDGYAGRGEYDDGSPGSPRLLAEHAVRFAAFRQITGVYVEANRKAFLNLQKVMARYDRPDDQVLYGDVSDHLPDIMATAEGAALFAFLDPFGTALDRVHVQQTLLGRPEQAPVEVLLHISVSTVARLGGLLRKRRVEGVELSAADRKTIDHATRFLGGDWWQEYFDPVRGVEDQERATDVALRVASVYEQNICGATNCMAVSMPIRPNPTALPKYVLVLFTRHLDGLWYFADAVGKAGREWQGAWRTELAEKQRAAMEAQHAGSLALFDIDDVLPDLVDFDPDEYERRHRTVWQQTIERNIQRVLEERGPFVLASRVDEVYGTVLGAAGERHVRAAVKALHRAGVVENTGVGGAFYSEVIRPTGAGMLTLG